MRLVETHTTAQRLRLTADTLAQLSEWLSEDHDEALSARSAMERSWSECLRLYEAKPRLPQRNVPVENAPNIEVPLGAIAADAIYAQAIDLIYNVSPVLTVRPNGRDQVQTAKAFQRWVNWLSANEIDARAASDHFLLDTIQLGTGVFYIPWTEKRKKTRVQTIEWKGPRCFALPVEDLILPGGVAHDLQRARFVSMRMWLTRAEIEEYAKAQKWAIGLIQPAGTVDPTRQQRERLGNTRSGHLGRDRVQPYEILQTYGYYDLDGDGLDEDLLVTWDRTSRSILKVRYNPYITRPFEKAAYQIRAHLPYGLGVVEMLKPFQEETTELHCARILNALLSNARVWITRGGTLGETLKVWMGKVISNVSDPKNDIVGLPMGDVNSSISQSEAIAMMLAERRVGMNDLTQPRPSNIMGSRTPGITALSMLNQATRRFAPAFDAMRLAHARAHMQAIYRYQERLLAGGDDAVDVTQQLIRVMQEDGSRIAKVLKDDYFDEAVTLELTASSSSINRESDRQNAILLANIMTQYYERLIQLAVVAANPQVPEVVRAVAKKIADTAGELADRTIRTFDQVRDPEALVVDLTEIFNELDRRTQTGLGGLGQLLQGVLGVAGGGGTAVVRGPAGVLTAGARGAGGEASLPAGAEVSGSNGQGGGGAQ